jgi:thiol-disulfide isomerase/thioredoxin
MTELLLADCRTASPSTNGIPARTARGLRRVRFALPAALLIGLVGSAQAAEPSRVRIGDPLPACLASVMNADKRLDLAAHRSRVLYVDFWASWCAPCARAFPFLNRLDAEFRQRGLTVVGISVDERLADAEHFLKRFPARFETAHDGTGSCPRAYGVIGMPSSYLIDRRGKIRAIHVGFRDGDAVQRTQEIERLLLETADAGARETKR